MFLLKEKGIVLGDDLTDELIKTVLKGFVCLVDFVGTVVPCGFDGTRQQSLKIGEFLGSGCPTELGCSTLETVDRSKKFFSSARRLIDADRDLCGYRSIVRIRSLKGLVVIFGRKNFSCGRVRFVAGAVKGDRRLFVHRNK